MASNGGKILKAFRNIDPFAMSGSAPGKLFNLVGGEWKATKDYSFLKDPMNGEKFLEVPRTNEVELDEFANDMKKCPKSGLHNMFKNPERYLLYGNVSRMAAELLHKPEISDHFTKLIQRVMPKHQVQAFGEVKISRTMLENFSGDNVRFLASSFQVAGDHEGQRSSGYRWPYGPVVIVCPFNFPLEIPVLQLMGALYMGNKVILKPNSKTTAVMEEFIRMLIYCGMPPEDVNLIHVGGNTFEKLYSKCDIRMTQFTGSSEVAERLCEVTNGKVKIEDAGFDWKVLGPDVSEVDYVAWQCDQDAYALSGQKCSAESILFAHENWVKAGIFDKIANLAKRRNINDLSSGPVLSVTNEEFEAHKNAILKMDGAKIICGGDYLENTKIPQEYGSFKPTAIYVPLKHFENPESFKILTTEIFGPFQVLTDYNNDQVGKILAILEKIPHHLTAAVVSKDTVFRNKILGNTVNGTTYAGLRARTTGAPQNHWFGPAGDPRGAGIGTAYAIQLVWSCHREIILEEGPIPQNWKMPEAS